MQILPNYLCSDWIRLYFVYFFHESFSVGLDGYSPLGSLDVGESKKVQQMGGGDWKYSLCILSQLLYFLSSILGVIIVNIYFLFLLISSVFWYNVYFSRNKSPRPQETKKLFYCMLLINIFPPITARKVTQSKTVAAILLGKNPSCIQSWCSYYSALSLILQTY